MLYEIINFSEHKSNNGTLVAIESGKDIPFTLKRIYYVYGASALAVRGKHAHKKLEQIIFCISGSCDFWFDNGTCKEQIHLDDPSKGIYIKSMIWREFSNFSKDCVVMVLASEHYEEDDYIRDYNVFKELVVNSK